MGWRPLWGLVLILSIYQNQWWPPIKILWRVLSRRVMWKTNVWKRDIRHHPEKIFQNWRYYDSMMIWCPSQRSGINNDEDDESNKIQNFHFVHWYCWYVQPQFRDPITVINMLPLQSYLMSGTQVTGLHRTGLGVTCCLTVVTIGFVGNIKPKVILQSFSLDFMAFWWQNK